MVIRFRPPQLLDTHCINQTSAKCERRSSSHMHGRPADIQTRNIVPAASAARSLRMRVAMAMALALAQLRGVDDRCRSDDSSRGCGWLSWRRCGARASLLLPSCRSLRSLSSGCG
jgi:hypothetical protein